MNLLAALFMSQLLYVVGVGGVPVSVHTIVPRILKTKVEIQNGKKTFTVLCQKR